MRTRGRRIRRELLALIAVVVIAVSLYALLRRGAGSKVGLRFSDALIIGIAAVFVVRVVRITRRQVFVSLPESIDAADIQPGEVLRSKRNEETRSSGPIPEELATFESMVQRASTDPGYFDTTFEPCITAIAAGATLQEAIQIAAGTSAFPPADVVPDEPEVGIGLENLSSRRWFPNRLIGSTRRRNLGRIDRWVRETLNRTDGDRA